MTLVFYIALYLFGLVCMLPLSRKLPLWLLAFTGFLWGILFWIAATMVVLFLGLTYSWTNMLLLLAPLMLVAIGVNIYYKTFMLSIRQLGTALASMALFSVLAFIVTQKHHVYASTDSFFIIYFARTMAETGLTPWASNQFTDWGVFVPVVLMTAHLLPGDYLSGYQTLLAGVLVSVFVTSIFQFTRIHFTTMVAGAQTAILATIFASAMFLNHAFYIHSNLPATVYLFVALYAYWHFLRTESAAWLILASLAITTFGFTRIEGVLYVLIFLMLVVGLKQHTYKQILAIVLPYATIAMLWYLYLYHTVVDTTGLLSRSNIVVILLALSGVIVVSTASRLPRASRLLRAAPSLMGGVLCAGLVVAFILKPDHMAASVAHILHNLTVTETWGWSWIVIVTLIILALDRDVQRPENRLLIYGAVYYILLVVLLAFARTPYRIGVTDSANRLLLHIQPILFLYIAIKADKFRAWLPARWAPRPSYEQPS